MASDPLMSEIGTAEFVDQSGLTYRQVDLWTTVGILEPVDDHNPGSGNPRRWYRRELLAARAVADLRASAGFHPQYGNAKAKQIAAVARAADPAAGRWLIVSERHGVIQGDDYAAVLAGLGFRTLIELRFP